MARSPAWHGRVWLSSLRAAQQKVSLTSACFARWKSSASRPTFASELPPERSLAHSIRKDTAQANSSIGFDRFGGAASTTRLSRLATF